MDHARIPVLRAAITCRPLARDIPFCSSASLGEIDWLTVQSINHRHQPRKSARSVTINAPDDTSLDEQVVRALVDASRVWQEGSTGKKGSVTYRKLYTEARTPATRKMATKWFDEVASIDEERDWSDKDKLAYFETVSKAVQDRHRNLETNDDDDGNDLSRTSTKRKSRGKRKQTKPDDTEDERSYSRGDSDGEDENKTQRSKRTRHVDSQDLTAEDDDDSRLSKRQRPSRKLLESDSD